MAHGSLHLLDISKFSVLKLTIRSYDTIYRVHRHYGPITSAYFIRFLSERQLGQLIDPFLSGCGMSSNYGQLWQRGLPSARTSVTVAAGCGR